MDNETKKINPTWPEWLQELVRAWPSNIVCRDQLGKFSANLLHPRTMSNADSRGEGPAGAIYFGRKVAYPTAAVADYIAARLGSKVGPVGKKSSKVV